jgi:hypothetical protein
LQTSESLQAAPLLSALVSESTKAAASRNFQSTAIEKIAPGWRARETYRILNDKEFIETFAMAEPSHDFATYSEIRFRRKK